MDRHEEVTQLNEAIGKLISTSRMTEAARGRPEREAATRKLYAAVRDLKEVIRHL